MGKRETPPITHTDAANNDVDNTSNMVLTRLSSRHESGRSKRAAERATSKRGILAMAEEALSKLLRDISYSAAIKRKLRTHHRKLEVVDH